MIFQSRNRGIFDRIPFHDCIDEYSYFIIRTDKDDTKCCELIFESFYHSEIGLLSICAASGLSVDWYIVDFGNLPFTAEINSRNSYVLFQFQILNRFSSTFSSKCLTFDNNKGAFAISFHIISIGEVKISTSSLPQSFSYKNKNNYHLFNPLIKYILNSSLQVQVSYSRLKNFWKTLFETFKSESCKDF